MKHMLENNYKCLVYGLSHNKGGVESIVTSLMNRLHEKISFDVLISGECSYAEDFESNNIDIIPINPWGINPWRFSTELKKILLNKSYDYIWINGCLMANRAIIRMSKRYSNARIITHSHGSSFEEKNFFKFLFLKFLHFYNRSYYLKNVDYPCCCSTASAEWYYGHKYCSSHRVYTINNGVDTTLFKFDEQKRKDLRRQLGVENEYVLLHAGRLTLVKNQKFLLDITKTLKNKGFHFKLLIAGTGELEQELKKYSQELDIADKVCFLGFRNDVSDLYQASDSFILTSFHEGLPVTIIEAQATGLQCFASSRITREADISGLVEFISLDETPDFWSQKIMDTPTLEDREKATLLVRERKYDLDIISKSFFDHILHN